MIDLYLTAALLLLILGIVGSIIPSLPGPLFSLTGVLLYWWSTGYSEPSNIVLILLISTGLLAFALDWIASYIGADKSGASKETAIAAALSSAILFLVSGPVGIVVGTAAVVFLRELSRGRKRDEAFKSAVYTTLGILASTVSKVILTSLMLLIFVASLLI